MPNVLKGYKPSELVGTDICENYRESKRWAEMRKISNYNAGLLQEAFDKGYSKKVTQNAIDKIKDCFSLVSTHVDKQHGTYYRTGSFRCFNRFCVNCSEKKANRIFHNLMSIFDRHLWEHPEKMKFYHVIISLPNVKTPEEAIDGINTFQKFWKKFYMAFRRTMQVREEYPNRKINPSSKYVSLYQMADYIEGLVSATEVPFMVKTQDYYPHFHMCFVLSEDCGDINTDNLNDIFGSFTGIEKYGFFVENSIVDKIDADFAQQLAMLCGYVAKGTLIDYRQINGRENQVKAIATFYDGLFKKTNLVHFSGKLFENEAIIVSKIDKKREPIVKKVLNSIGERENGLEEEEYFDITKEYATSNQDSDSVQNTDVNTNVTVTQNITKLDIDKKQVELWKMDNNQLSFLAHNSQDSLEKKLSIRVLSIKLKCKKFAIEQQKRLDNIQMGLYNCIVDRARTFRKKQNMMRDFHEDYCINSVYNKYHHAYVRSSKIEYNDNGSIKKVEHYHTFMSDAEFKKQKEIALENAPKDYHRMITKTMKHLNTNV